MCHARLPCSIQTCCCLHGSTCVYTAPLCTCSQQAVCICMCELLPSSLKWVCGMVQYVLGVWEYKVHWVMDWWNLAVCANWHAVLMWVAVSRVCCCRKYYLLGPCKSWPYSVFRLQSLEVGDDNYSHQVFFLKNLNLPKPDKWGTNQLPSFIQQVRTKWGRKSLYMILPCVLPCVSNSCDIGNIL